MGNLIRVNGTELGTGKPKICVPLVAKTLQELQAEAKSAARLGAQLAEWRVDYYESIELPKVQEALELLKKELGQIPLLFTFRTLKEGGERSIEPDQYKELAAFALKSGLADLVDVEFSAGEKAVQKLAELAHKEQRAIVVSAHNFKYTLPADEILKLLLEMHAAGADVVKVAVMPQSSADVLELLQGTESFHRLYPDVPLITMSMGALGSISRVAGEFFGSCVSFASLNKASAPGQLAIQDLQNILDVLHAGFEKENS